MDDNSSSHPQPLGAQIRRLRLARGFSLTELAKRAGTSAPALHRYESGWDRFGLATLRRIASALGARLEVRLTPGRQSTEDGPDLPAVDLVRLLAPLFWDKPLSAADLDAHPRWVLTRALMFGDRRQVAALRRRYGDDAVLRAARSRGVDAKTRNYWELVLRGSSDAPQGPE